MKGYGLALSVLTACALAACGGGGSDSSTPESAAQVQADPALAKYLGTWESCNANGGGSKMSRARVLSVQRDTATVEIDYQQFNIAGCTGAPALDFTVKGTAKLAGGTKALAAQTNGAASLPARTYEKALLTYTGFTLRAGTLDFALPMPNATAAALITLAADGKVYFGMGRREADGYPKSHSPIALTKRP